ncbi:hypothetical protein [Neolewinella antarctica]|uniref:Uncharacterized protein n=1 Tax=Neolewinella antarctica TaxID=442734 RepID=A0ABX0XAW1_9BACT|nr:hypothetical protein [Neolewinella antarctica]NJC26408.1 hypothetical protein [Neolewinella antarctica]
MNVVRATVPLLLSFFLCTCGNRPNELAEDGAGVDTGTTPEIDNPNEDNTDIYDVDPEDPYLMSNGAILGLKPGEPLGEYADGLRTGRIRTGEGDFDVYFIDGAEGDELGYLLPDPTAKSRIGDIILTAPTVVTEKGIRVGLTYAELIERLGAVAFHGSETEARVYGTKDGLRYRLDVNSTKRDLTEADIEPGTRITEIVINRQGPR